VQITEATQQPADHRVDDQLEAVDHPRPGHHHRPHQPGHPVDTDKRSPGQHRPATTGTIPTLPAGTYKIAAFSVDRTGNVSAPTTTTFTI
jgi:hypothetical protein